MCFRTKCRCDGSTVIISDNYGLLICIPFIGALHVPISWCRICFFYQVFCLSVTAVVVVARFFLLWPSSVAAANKLKV